MSALNPLSGLTLNSAATQDQVHEGENGQMGVAPGMSAVYSDKLGRTYKVVPGPDGGTYIQYFQNDGSGFATPNGTGSNRDRVQPTYKLNADGTATPQSANTSYNPGEWVNNGQAVATGVAIMVATYFGGSWLAAYEAGAVTAPVAGAAATETGSGLAAGVATDATGATVSSGAAGAGYGGAGAAWAPTAATATTGSVGGAVGTGTGSTIGESVGQAAGAQAGGTTAAGSSTGLSSAQTAYGALEAEGAAAGMGGNATAAGTFGTAGASATPAQMAAAQAAVAAGNGASASLIPGISNAQLLQTGLSLAATAAASNSSSKAIDAAKSAQDAQNANAATAQDIAKDQLGLSKQQYEDAKARQAIFDPKFLAAIDASLASQKTQDERSAQQWKQYQDYFMPAEQKLATSAMNYDTPGRRAEAEAEARAAVGAEAANGRMAQGRALDRAGVKIDSGKALTLNNASRLMEAKATGAAGVGARKQTELTGLSLVDNVAKVGRGVTSTGLQAAGLGINAGQAATGGLAQNQSTYNASLVPGQTSAGIGLSAVNSSNNAYNDIINNSLKQQQLYNSAAAGLGSLAGQLFSNYGG